MATDLEESIGSIAHSAQVVNVIVVEPERDGQEGRLEICYCLG